MCDISSLEKGQLWERLSKDDCSFRWALIGLESGAAGAKPRAYVKSIGATPLADMMGRLPDNEIVFGIVKIYGVDPKGAVVSRRTKAVFFTWFGDKVSRIQKMNATSAKSAVSSYFRGSAVSVEVFERDDPINEVELEKRLRACGGAHQPDHFDFPSGDASSVQEFTSETQPAVFGASATGGGEA